jgi:hypothetical protein
MQRRSWVWMVGVVAVGCVPPGSAGEQDAGKGAPATPQAKATAAATVATSPDVMKIAFEDDFERPGGAPSAAPVAPPAPSGSSTVPSASPAPMAGDPGPEWMTTGPGIWRIENGHLCGEHAKNHGIWLKRTLPVNARIEFDGISMSADGDLKAEYWGDGRSFATSLSYTNATSYLTIYGGEKPVMTAQSYHFTVERADGKTVKWWVDGNEMLSWTDTAPLSGPGHDHFGFNDWDVKVCFDNVKVVPLPAP